MNLSPNSQTFITSMINTMITYSRTQDRKVHVISLKLAHTQLQFEAKIKCLEMKHKLSKKAEITSKRIQYFKS